ncbi:MAG TPA: hypothetical protein ENK05_12415 [Gammaproteobacteria bacterium]|nr:hypothetical protein [Gammaproteobacteria bacterium]
MDLALKADHLRLAMLPVAYISEQADPFAGYHSDSAVGPHYRDVVLSSVWTYQLYHYLALVRDRFGDDTVDSVWACQQLLFEEEDAGAAEAIESAFILIDLALDLEVPGRSAGGAGSAPWQELAVAQALLFGLPESPAFVAADRPPPELPPGIDWYLARVLARGQKAILAEFAPLFDSPPPPAPVVQPPGIGSSG